MQGIILAGGNGTRLRPLTQELPKPMIPVLNKPLMEYTIELLKRYEIQQIGVTLKFLPQHIKNYFSGGEKWGTQITYFEEETPLGTAGSVKAAENFIQDTFIVVSGDALTNIDISKILTYHKSIHADVTIVLSKQENPLEYGVVLTDTDGRITSFCEKPQWENVITNTVNTVIYIIEKKILEKIPAGTVFDFSNDLFPLLLKENANMYGYITEDYWSDLGTPEAYLQAQWDLLEGKVFGREMGNVFEENVSLGEEVKVVSPVYIGKNTVITGKSTIGPDAVIGSGCIIENSRVERAVLWNQAVLLDSDCINAVMGSKTKAERTLFGGNNIVGSHVVLNRNTQLITGASVFNNIEIERNATVEGKKTSGNPVHHTLWNNGTITGLWNHEIDHSTLAAIASSYPAAKILVCSSGERLAGSLAMLISSYYSLCGSTVYVSSSQISSCRYYAAVYKMKAVYIRTAGENLFIDLMDENGLNISSQQEKKIDFKTNDFSLKRGKMIRLHSLDGDFEYFLNNSIPFSKSNVELYTNEAYRLHNIVPRRVSEFTAPLNRLYRAAVIAQNGTVQSVFAPDGSRISTDDFMRLKIRLTAFYDGKEVFLPDYASEEIRNLAQTNGLRVLKLMQHKGNTMQQLESFHSFAALLEFEPSFFAETLAYFLDSRALEAPNETIVAKLDFECDPKEKCATIFALNKDKNSTGIQAEYKGGFITVIPSNNGYSFTAYGRFAREEYAADITEEFIKDRINKEK